MPQMPDFNATVNRYVHARLRDPDLAQDALLAAWERRDGYDLARGPLGPWIVSLGVNLARDRAKRRRVEAAYARRLRTEAHVSIPPNQEDRVFTRELLAQRALAPAVAAAVGACSANGSGTVSRARAAARQFALAG